MNRDIVRIYSELGDRWLHQQVLLSRLENAGYSAEESVDLVNSAIASGELVESSDGDGSYRLRG
ncbi:hypothetical protein [Halomonas litopenaei]|uniref:hypothetical protein n=1 Tax=Halomonas litopenaei TaxID=2109328 RepID=UPI003F9F6FD0